MKLTKHPENPILSPNPANAWESLSVCNPGACYDEEKGIVYLLYRAGDQDPAYTRCLGLATSQDGIHFQRVSDEPFMRPEPGRWDGGALEDPRVVKIGEWYYISYVVFPRAQGQVYLPPEQRTLPPIYPEAFPAALKWNVSNVGLALTRDFKEVIRIGPMAGAWDQDRNTMLFPEQIQGRWWKIHRPARWKGKGYPCEAPSIWISHSHDTLYWNPEHAQLLLKAEYEWEGEKVGANTPPIQTDKGWLMIYHGVSQKDHHYRLGAVLLDLEDPRRVTHRTREWIMEPTEAFELKGLYREGGVVFPCGAIVKDGTLMVYYGGGDQHIGLATCDFNAFVDELATMPVS